MRLSLAQPHLNPHLSSSLPSSLLTLSPLAKMDPVTAVGFAASILNFIDFSWNLVQGSYEVYKSASGTTAENAHISTVLEDLREVTEELYGCGVGSVGKYGKQLSKLSKNCLDLSRDLIKILEKYGFLIRMSHQFLHIKSPFPPSEWGLVAHSQIVLSECRCWFGTSNGSSPPNVSEVEAHSSPSPPNIQAVSHI